MFNSSFLDIVISMIFLYLLLALVVTGINEFFFTFRRQRAKHLKRALKLLFYDDEWKEIFPKLIESSFIKVLQRKEHEFPAYIPSENFAKALLSIMGEGKIDFRSIKDRITKTEGKGEFSTLIDYLMQSGVDNIEKLQNELQKIFDQSMDRVAGWYKRNAKLWSFYVAAFLAIGFNIDSMQIARDMFKNKEKAKINADAAQDYLADTANVEKKVIIIKSDSTERMTLNPEAGMNTEVYIDIDTSNTISSETNVAVDTMLVSTDSTVADSEQIITKEPEEIIKDIKIVVAEIDKMDVPMGWIKGNYPEYNKSETIHIFILDWLAKLFGLLITAFAVSLGAPFWFDLLGKVSPLRKKDK